MRNFAKNSGTAILLLFTLASCDKKSCEATGEVDIFLLESFETVDPSCAIDPSTARIKDKALIAYSELNSYNSTEHIFKISDAAAEVVKNLEHSVFGLPFAVVADGELIYTGYFWPSYSSASCQWIVIDPLMISGENELRVAMGYPVQFEGIEIPDQRNNAKILAIFKRDGKLID